jgi:metal-responsive CopG/Arc/MetJ family transcriptional regulator
MPGEYGNKRSISVYIEKEIVEEIERLAYEQDMQRSTFIAELIRNCLEKRGV